MSETFQNSLNESRSNQETILEVRGATVSFDMSRGEARVLDGVTIDIYRGETLGIAGESGCGKSMFASALLDSVSDPGILSGNITYYPESGEPVNILDLSKSDLNRIRWEEISIVSQGALSAFNPTTPIKSHFMDTLEAHNIDKEAGMERAKGVLRDLNLDPRRIFGVKTYQHELSGGERQRILIALSLLLEPEVLVLDEPTGALDLLTQRSILRLLHEIKTDYDLTLVFISHDLPIITGFADRLGIMYAFEFVELGETDDVMHDPSHPYTRGLLRATPNLTMPVDEITTVEGTSPDPVNVPPGCPYHPRCPVADDRCEIEKPDLVEMDAVDHRAACFYTDQSKNAIPVTFAGDDDS